jgi:hypothetical protein
MARGTADLGGAVPQRRYMCACVIVNLYCRFRRRGAATRLCVSALMASGTVDLDGAAPQRGYVSRSLGLS